MTVFLLLIALDALYNTIHSETLIKDDASIKLASHYAKCIDSRCDTCRQTIQIS